MFSAAHAKSAVRNRLLHAAPFLLLTALCAAQEMTTLPLPPRPAGAMTGSQFYNLVTSATVGVREQYVVNEIASGNVPDFIRTLRPITVSATIGGTPHTATYYVTPDYMAIGSDADFFRMPMSAPLAQQIADTCGCTLTTRKMTNDVYTNCQVKVAPYPFSPAVYDIMSVPVFWASNSAIEGQRLAAGHVLGQLLGGTKKDVVVTPQIATMPSPPRVAIYGWHQLSGVPIQNLYLGHEAAYHDYSHGIRLVRNYLTVDSSVTTVGAVLSNANLAALLSDEGAFATYRYPIPDPYTIQAFPYVDSFPSTGRQLSGWIDRFQTPVIMAFSPASPGGDGYLLAVRDTSGGIDTTRLGRPTDQNYYVECDIYCDYRPALAADGYERVGVFARDNGNAMFDGISGGGVQGNCYAMTWDSNNGRLQCLRVVNGVPTDLLPAPVYHASSGWREMRIELVGQSLVFKLNGALLLSTTDSTHSQGQFGIGYHEFFTTNANILGTYADNFRADVTGSSAARDWEIY